MRTRTLIGGVLVLVLVTGLFVVPRLVGSTRTAEPPQPPSGADAIAQVISGIDDLGAAIRALLKDPINATLDAIDAIVAFLSLSRFTTESWIPFVSRDAAAG